MKRMLLNKGFGLFCLAVVIFTQNTCTSPVGLGNRTDLSAPVISIPDMGPGVGEYLSGTERIWIEAEDDSGLISSVVVTYSYSEYLDGTGNNRAVRPRSSEPIHAIKDEATGYYYIDIVTGSANEEGIFVPLMADGALKLVVSATDNSGKTTTTPELIYTVKNKPPTVNMQIPRPRTTTGSSGSTDVLTLLDAEPYPVVVTDTFLMGIFEDLAGVAQGYPWIKLWKDGDDEPMGYQQNAGWANVISPDRDRGDGWVQADEGYVESEKGDRGGSFRFYLRDRQPSGKEYPEAEEGEQGYKLATGSYRIKIKALDILGHEVIWPTGAYDNAPPNMPIELISNGIPPEVYWSDDLLEKQYFKEDFTLSAEAKVSPSGSATGIAEMSFTVTGKDKSGQKPQVILKHEYPPNLISTYPLTMDIELGKTYYNIREENGDTTIHVTDSEANLPTVLLPRVLLSYVTFTDGNFTFTVHARDDIGASGSVPLSLYIDCQPPKTEVTRVSPYFSQDKIADTAAADNPRNGIDYRRWTVNSSIKIDVNSTDNRGSATEDIIDPVTKVVNSYEKIKYLVLKDDDIEEAAFTAWKTLEESKPENAGKIFDFGDYLYQHPDAAFLDYIKANPKSVPAGVAPNGNPLSFIEGGDGAYTMIFQTHKYFPGADDIPPTDTTPAVPATPYKVWAYVVSMDNSDNVSYQKILLNIDQDTDKPVIVFGNINSDGSSFIGDLYDIRLNIKDDDGLMTNSVEYRYAKNLAERNSFDLSDTGWMPIKQREIELSEDKLEININALTLLDIACDLLHHDSQAGHEMDAAHKVALGFEKETKYIQVRATDNKAVPPKVYLTDDEKQRTSEWRSFTMDLTSPMVAASTKDLSGDPISGRSVYDPLNPDVPDNPFGAPEKDMAYKALPFVYGDIIEQNLESITVKIDGIEAFTRIYQVANSNYPDTQPAGNDFAVWKAEQSEWVDSQEWNGELRWRIPMTGAGNLDFNLLSEGSHTFEITFKDKIPQSTTKSLPFFKDTQGPTVNFTVPGSKFYMSASEVASIDEDNITPTGELKVTYDNLVAYNNITDDKVKLSGNFFDEYSSVFSAANNRYYYKLDNGGWTTVNVAEFDKKLVSWVIELPDTIKDGIHRLSFRVKDASGNGYDSTASVPAGDSGPGYETDLAFIIDRGVPKVAITNAGSLYKGNFDIDVEVTDVRGIGDNVEVDLNGKIYTYNVNGKVTTDALDKTKHIFTIPVVPPVPASNSNPPSNSVDEGQNSISVTVTATSLKSRTGTWKFTYDNAPPVITLGNPFTGNPVILDDTEWGNIRSAINTNSIANNLDTLDSGLRAKFDLISTDSVKNRILQAMSVNFYDEHTSVSKFRYRIEGMDGQFKTVLGDGWIEVTPPANSRNVTHLIDLQDNLLGTGLTEGIYRLSIEATDANNNENTTTTVNVGFMLDRDAPVIDIDEWKASSNAISGTIHNTFKVNSKEVLLNGARISDLDVDIIPAGNRTFNLSATPNQSSFPDGSYSVDVTVESSSLQTATKRYNTTIDTTPPEITLGAPITNEEYLSTADWNDISSALAANTISSLTPGQRTAYAAISANGIKTAGSRGITVTIADELSAIKEYWYRFAHEAPGYWTHEDLTVGGTVEPTARTKLVEVQIPLENGSYKNGIYNLSIRTKDVGDNGYDHNYATPESETNGIGLVHNLVFMVDTSIPAITDLKITKDPVTGNSILTGTIGNTFGVTEPKVSLNGTPVTSAITIAANGSRTFNLTTDLGTLPDGDHSADVTITGSSLQNAREMATIVYDTTPPEITIGVPIINAAYVSNANWTTISGAVTGNTISSLSGAQLTAYEYIRTNGIKTASSRGITVNIADGLSAIKEYWYRFAHEAPGYWTHEDLTVGGTVEPTARTTTFTVPIPLANGGNYENGIYSLSIRTMDIRDNGYDLSLVGEPQIADNGVNSGAGIIHNLVFMVDTSTPTITGLTITKNAVGSSILTGTIGNTFEVTERDILLDGTPVLPAAVTIAANGFRTFNLTADLGLLNDGYYSADVTVTGSSGATAKDITTITYDTTPPEITVGAPIMNANYLSNDDWTAIRNAVNGNTIASLTPPQLVTYEAIRNNGIKTAGSRGITVNITDEYSAIKEYWYKFDYQAAWTLVDLTKDENSNTVTPTLRSVPFTLPMPLESAPYTNGIYSLSIRTMDARNNGYDNSYNPSEPAVDNGNGFGFIHNLVFMVDTSVPVVGLEQDDDNPKIFNGTITNTFEVIGLTITPEWPGATEVTLTALPTDPRTFTYSYTVPGIIPEGSNTITVRAEGSSGQSAAKTLSFVYDTTAPVISINSPITAGGNGHTGQESYVLNDDEFVAIATAIENNDLNFQDSYTGISDNAILRVKYNDILLRSIPSMSVPINVNFTDENSKIGEYSYTFSQVVFNSPGESADIFTKTTAIINGRNSESISIDLTNSAQAPVLLDGLYRLTISARDEKGNPPASTPQLKNIAFILDTNTPEIAVTDYAGGPTVSGGSLKTTNTDFDFGLTISNTFAVTSLSVSLNDTVIAKYDSTNGIGIPNSLTAPTVPVTNRTFTSDVTLDFGKNASDEVTVNGVVVGLEDGSNSVSITAVGSSGNAKTVARSFIYDTTPPDITFTSPIREKSLVLTGSDVNNGDFGAINTAIANKTIDGLSPTLLDTFNAISDMNSIKDSSTNTLKGTFTDTYSSIAGTFEYKIEGAAANGVVNGNWVTPAKAVTPIPGSSNSANWEITLPSNLADGIYRLSVRVNDGLGNGYGIAENVAFLVDRKTPVVAFTSPASQTTQIDDFEVTGTINAAMRIQRLSVMLDGNPYAYYVGVGDANEKGVFVYDGTDYVKETTSPATITVNTEGTGLTSHFEFTAKISLDGITDDGSKTVSVIAMGTSGSTGSQILLYTYDTQGPQISLNPPLGEKVYGELDQDGLGNTTAVTIIPGTGNVVDNTIKDATITLSGSFIDEYSVIYQNLIDNEIYYKVEGLTASANAIINQPWQKVAADTALTITTVTTPGVGSKSLVWKLVLPDNTEDGSYLLSIRIKDSLGNGYGITPADDAAVTAAINAAKTAQLLDPAIDPYSGAGYLQGIAFLLDRGKPELAVDDLSLYQRGVVTITGTVTQVNSADLTVKLNSRQSTIAEIVDNPADDNDGIKWGGVGHDPSAKNLKFTVTLPAISVNQSYSVQIIASGSSGYTAMDVLNFIYDKDAPTVNFTAPAKGTQVGSDGTWNETVGTPPAAVTYTNSYKVVNSGVWVTGSPTISGTAEDPNGITSVYFHLGKFPNESANRDAIYADTTDTYWTDTGLGTDAVHTNWTGSLTYWNFQAPLNSYWNGDQTIIDRENPADGLVGNNKRFIIPLYVKTEDQAGNKTVAVYRIYVDPDMDMPLATFINPSDNDSVGGSARISGTANDNTMVYQVQIRIKPDLQTGGPSDTALSNRLQNGYYKDNADKWAYPVTNYPDGWEYSEGGFNPASSANPDEIGWIIATIQGQNDLFVPWSYFSNKDTLLNPVTDQARQVTIEVRAIDTKFAVDEERPDLKGIPVSIVVNFATGVPTIETPVIEKGTTSKTFADGDKTSGLFKIKTTVKDEGGISAIRARVTGGSGLIELVRNGAVLTGGNSMGNVTTWAIPNDNASRPTIQTLTAPGWRYQLTDPGSLAQSAWEAIDVDYTTGKTYAVGTYVRLKSGVNQTGLSGYRANSGTVAGSDTDSTNWNTQFFVYALEFTVDTTSANSSLTYGRTGDFTLEIQVEDNNQLPDTLKASGKYTLGVDNLYPNAVITTQFNAVTSNFYVQGTARDFNTGAAPSIQGLARMLVYFSRGDTYYDAAGTDITSSMTTRDNVRDTTVDGFDNANERPNVSTGFRFPAYTYPTNPDVPNGKWTSTQAMVIDVQELDAESDSGDNDGVYAEQWQDDGADKVWKARLDTTALTTAIKDGPLTVHYVIVDNAGNATHYQADVYVGNRRPFIRSVNLGTDINGNGSVTDWTSSTVPGEYRASPIAIGDTATTIIPTGFKVRNSRFGLRLDALYGNNYKHYRISHVTENATATSAAPASTPNHPGMVRGNVYKIATPGNTDWRSYGAPNNDAGTVFVATGPARPTSDTGTVYGYTYGTVGDGREVVGDFTTRLNNAPPTTATPNPTGDFATATFTNFANMPDSTGKEYVDGNLTLKRDKIFIIKVYDSTVTTDPDSATFAVDESQQLAHVALINVDFDNTDTRPPMIDVATFGRKYVKKAEDPDTGLYTTMANNADKELGYVAEYNENIATVTETQSGRQVVVKKGYVQYVGHAGANDEGRPSVSGKVIFKGRAMDNNRITRITATIPGYTPPPALAANPGIGFPGDPTAASGSEFTIAYWNVSTLAVSRTGWTIAAMSPDTATPPATINPWGFEVEEQYLTLDYSHVLNWNFAWDTSTLTNVVGNNVTVTFKVYDVNGNTTPNEVAVKSEVKTMPVNIVPYITEVVTSLSGAYSVSPSAFNRSALGGYPVREDETITINGFNLAVGATRPEVAIETTPTRTVIASNTTNTGNILAGFSKNSIRVIVDNNTTRNSDTDTNGVNSGALTVTVGTGGNAVTSLNNRNSTTADYNKEPNNLNNNTLNDDRYIYVWRTGALLTRDDHTALQTPFMRMDNSANLYMIYGIYENTNGRLKVMKNHLYYNAATGTPSAYDIGGTGGTNSVESNGNRYLNATIAVDGAGEWYAASSNQTSVTGNDVTFSVFARRGYNGAYNSASTGRRRIVRLNNDINRIKVPRMAVQSTNGAAAANDTNPARVFMSIYDGTSGTANAVVFYYGYVGGTAAAPNWGGSISAENDTNNLVTTAGAAQGRGQIVASNTTTKAQGGQYTAAGGLTNGRPVVAWFDRNSRSLWFSYGSGAPAAAGTANYYNTTANSYVYTDTDTWQANAVEIKQFAGSHVDMVVDGGNNVHLAYYDVINGGLWYTYIPYDAANAQPNSKATPTSGTSAVNDNVKTVRVDTYLSAGTKLMLNVRQDAIPNANGIGTTNRYVPYITYYHGSFTETQNSVRVAWRKDFSTPAVPLDGTNTDDSFTGAWEVMTVPAGNTPVFDEFISNGVPTGTGVTWAPTATANSIKSRALDQSILVGYMTNAYYEGASLKDDMRKTKLITP